MPLEYACERQVEICNGFSAPRPGKVGFLNPMLVSRIVWTGNRWSVSYPIPGWDVNFGVPARPRLAEKSILVHLRGPGWQRNRFRCSGTGAGIAKGTPNTPDCPPERAKQTPNPTRLGSKAALGACFDDRHCTEILLAGRISILSATAPVA